MVEGPGVETIPGDWNFQFYGLSASCCFRHTGTMMMGDGEVKMRNG